MPAKVYSEILSRLKWKMRCTLFGRMFQFVTVQHYFTFFIIFALVSFPFI
ncbi:hypothetical protein CHCC20335_1050 [Bacillus paralicheniformis]|nr:hypothetical protein CHCC20335_1050 [Bacillus paralicheniformis]